MTKEFLELLTKLCKYHSVLLEADTDGNIWMRNLPPQYRTKEFSYRQTEEGYIKFSDGRKY